MNEALAITPEVEQLLQQAGFNPDILSLKQCVNGGNNRTYRLETTDGVFALKKYFREAGDVRDRLASEYALVTYASSVASNMTPKAYAKDDVSGLALYEFLDGSPLKLSDIGKDEVMSAANFFCALNKTKDKAANLPLASEACFTIEDHLKLIGARIKSLQQIVPEIAEDKLAEQQIQHLNARWELIVQQVMEQSANAEFDMAASLSMQDRCISPSDFGFHNALRMSDGSIRFIDFEYAGWDDPAKMVGDFFSQLAIPVSSDYFTDFTYAVMQPFSATTQLIRRAQILRPVYQVKWCCIALNIFIPVHLARRKFANPQLNVVDLKQAQLSKVASILKRMEGPQYV